MCDVSPIMISDIKVEAIQRSLTSQAPHQPLGPAEGTQTMHCEDETVPGDHSMENLGELCLLYGQ